jgi:hypothetical protein
MLSPLVGCFLWGGGSSSSSSTNSTQLIITKGQSGKVVQGAVSGATVWADSLTSGTRFVIDADEQSTETTTAADGTFTLPVQPSYKYVVVSQGGTDSITGMPATTMLAPAGATSVSALTTLVALDTSGNMASIINGLLPAGTTFDSDISATGGLSPAAMVVVTAIESAVTDFDQTVQKAASASSTTLSQQQQNDINLTVYSSIASQLSSLSSTSLSNTQSLASSLQTSLSSAIATIQTNNTNITLQNTATVAASIANNAVAISANVVGNATGNTSLQNVTASNVQSTGVAVTTSSTVTESTVMASGTNTQIVNNNTNTVDQTLATDVTTTSTPTSYAPPVIAVANNPSITGYQLTITASGSEWQVQTFTIAFSDDMVATSSGASNFGHSVLNPANYQFSQTGCSPTSYSSDVVTFTCGNLSAGTFAITVNASTSSGGVWTSATSLGLLVNNSKSFALPTVSGSSGGSSISMF